jgi:hypothetical protein
MRSRLIPAALSLYLVLSLSGCTSNPSTDTATDTGGGTDAQSTTEKGGKQAKERKEGKESKESKEAREANAEKREPLAVPTGTAVTVSLGSALGSKLSQPGQTFSGSVAKNVVVGGAVAIPKGSTVGGTVTDAKPLGKFAGGAILQVRLDSINLNGTDLPVQVALRTFSVKGKGKRTGIMAGGGAALGGLIGGLAGGGKGAAIGMAAGGGAGAGGAALTGNNDVVLPAESAVTFQLSQALEIAQ